jgi:hypothetical protein
MDGLATEAVRRDWVSINIAEAAMRIICDISHSEGYREGETEVSPEVGSA